MVSCFEAGHELSAVVHYVAAIGGGSRFSHIYASPDLVRPRGAPLGLAKCFGKFARSGLRCLYPGGPLCGIDISLPKGSLRFVLRRGRHGD